MINYTTCENCGLKYNPEEQDRCIRCEHKKNMPFSKFRSNSFRQPTSKNISENN